MCEGGAGVSGAEPGVGPALVGCSSPLDLVMTDSLTVITRWRILVMVLRSTRMRKEAGESQEALPGLSRTTPFAFFRDRGWYPNVTWR